MRDPVNIMEVVTLQPDFMGFIFYPGSKRFVGDAFEIPKHFPKEIKKTGVFVNTPVFEVIEKIQKYKLNAVQLHGAESLEQCSELRTHAKVIKVFLVDEKFNFAITDQYRDACDYFLFDTKSESLGGSGRSFDWKLLNKYKGNIPFFLSGGLSPDNITDAMKLDHPAFFAVDVNSGVESGYGIKDIDKIVNFKSKIVNLTK